ncbi:Glycine-rich RNA-binding protein 2, mitochondrial [Neofusicoccum ribis]|uniref:Glycine-rich RNA-binding protein 2, mitochondrial n=1 Tax=Neofusicoccum ribis TaxID=45134 RepID=A0ABR3SZ10_9PEZI
MAIPAFGICSPLSSLTQQLRNPGTAHKSINPLREVNVHLDYLMVIEQSEVLGHFLDTDHIGSDKVRMGTATGDQALQNWGDTLRVHNSSAKVKALAEEIRQGERGVGRDGLSQWCSSTVVLRDEHANLTDAAYLSGDCNQVLNNALNNSNQVIAAFVMGKCKSGIPPTTTFIWTDVRDLALGHVLAMEKEEAGGKRFFFTSGHFANKELAAIIRNNFPEYEDKLPPAKDQGGDFPAEGVYKVDKSQTK